MGPSRFELLTSSLSGTRSNQLSYEPGTLPVGLSSRPSKLQAGHFRAFERRVNRAGS